MNAEKIKHVSYDYQDLTSRIVRLETHKENLDMQLTEIKTSLNNIAASMSVISTVINKYEGAAAARHRIWTLTLGVVGGIGALGLHTFIFKFFGVQI